MTDKESAVMDELWRTVNSLRWQTKAQLAAIQRYRDWLPSCQDRETRTYYKKWLDWLENETHQDVSDAERRERARKLDIERPT